MLLLAFGKGIPRRPLELLVPSHWLLLGVVFLLGLRIGLNMLNSNVIDVGYAGVIGADKLIHGHLLYGHWPHDNAYGDTYGPINYFAYVPFRLIFGWSGHWDALPAAHAAAIVFDLLTVGGLYMLGRRIRDHALGVVLMYAWVAYPFTLFTLTTNSNDALVAALLVFALLAIGSPAARGVMGAMAGLTKFAPFALAPLLWRGTGERPGKRSDGGLRRRLRRDGGRGDAPGAPQRQSSLLLARLDRLPVRPRDPVLDLGAVGRAGRRPAPARGCGGRPRDPGRVRPLAL